MTAAKKSVHGVVRQYELQKELVLEKGVKMIWMLQWATGGHPPQHLASGL